MSKTFFCSLAVGPDEQALRTGLIKCIELAVAGGHASANIVVPKKDSLKGLIQKVLGDTIYASLIKTGEAQTSDVTIRLATEQIPLVFPGPVLLAWTGWDHTKEVAASYLATDVIFLPWRAEELDEFRQEYAPTTL